MSEHDSRPPYQLRDDFVMIGGIPRSGTTLLHVILNNHPGIAVFAEYNLDYFVLDLSHILNYEFVVNQLQKRLAAKRSITSDKL